MRAYRYTDDDLKDIYGKWDMKTNFHEGNCLPKEEWSWPIKERPQTDDELIRKIYETPFNDLKLFYGSSSA